MTERDIKQYYLGMMAGIRRAKFIDQEDNETPPDNFVYLDGEEYSIKDALQKLREERDMNLRVRKEEKE